MADYVLDTFWQVAAGPETIWPALTAVEEWPVWWRGVLAVERLEEGDSSGLGRRYRTTWRGWLPYTLTFETETTQIEHPVLIEGQAHGQLRGTGTWRLWPDGEATQVHYRWAVCTTQPWMNALAPLARPIFRWNHDAIMRWGAEGLSRRLNVPVRFAVGASGR
ncbi:MAG TPA: polyketide cyclase [Xanthomonadaceae bacterium]|nr:polyketide cyclase [Xanthomonadaceae bacterium]